MKKKATKTVTKRIRSVKIWLEGDVIMTVTYSIRSDEDGFGSDEVEDYIQQPADDFVHATFKGTPHSIKQFRVIEDYGVQDEAI